MTLHTIPHFSLWYDSLLLHIWQRWFHQLITTSQRAGAPIRAIGFVLFTPQTARRCVEAFSLTCFFQHIFEVVLKLFASIFNLSLWEAPSLFITLSASLLPLVINCWTLCLVQSRSTNQIWKMLVSYFVVAVWGQKRFTRQAMPWDPFLQIYTRCEPSSWPFKKTIWQCYKR